MNTKSHPVTQALSYSRPLFASDDEFARVMRDESVCIFRIHHLPLRLRKVFKASHVVTPDDLMRRFAVAGDRIKPHYSRPSYRIKVKLKVRSFNALRANRP